MKAILSALLIFSVGFSALADSCEKEVRATAKALAEASLKAKFSERDFTLGELSVGSFSVYASKGRKEASYVINTDESCAILKACQSKEDDEERCYDDK